MASDIRSTHAVRLGLRQVKGFRVDDAEAVMAARDRGFDSVRDLWLRTGLPRATIERLADADAFRSIGLDRRDALWAARGLAGGGEGDRLPLFDRPEHHDIAREPDVALPPMPVGEHVVNDYRFLSLSLKAHPLSFLRRRLAADGIIENLALRDVATRGGAGRRPDREETRGEESRRPDREVETRGEERQRRDREVKNPKRVTVAGLVLVRQRPGSANGVIFMTLEDETDIANVIVWPKIFERFRPVVLGARLVAVTGRVQSESGVIHVVADRLIDRTADLYALSEDAGDMESLARADEVRRPQVDMREKIGPRSRLVRLAKDEPGVADDLAAIAEKAGRAMPKGRNFH